MVDNMKHLPTCERLRRERGFTGVKSANVHDFLPYYESMILAANDFAAGEYDWTDIVEHLEDGRWQLWITPKSCGITAVYETGGGHKTCRVMFGSGDLEDMVDCIRGLIEWARSEGCDRFYVEGRKGWGRALKDLGAKLRYHAYTVDLEG